MKNTTFILLLFCTGCTGYAAEGSRTFSIPAKQVFPVVITGKQLLQKANDKIKRNSIQVRTAQGKTIPVQVDCRDEQGRYISRETPLLAPQDEIVFLTVPDGGSPYRILYGEQKGKPAVFPDGITVALPASFTDLTLSNTDSLQIGIKASGARPDEEKIQIQADGNQVSEQSETTALPMEYLIRERRKKVSAPSKSSRGDYSKGGMTIRFRNKEMTGVSWENQTVPVQPFGRSWDSPAWSIPKIIASGPVRKIVQITYEENVQNDLIKNGLYLRKGFRGPVRVEHLFTVYAKTGIVDFSEKVEYANVDLCALLAYSFPLKIGNVPDKEQLLLIPDDIEDGHIRADVQKSWFSGTDDVSYVFFTNPIFLKEMPGYFGWMDPTSKISVSVFYESFINERETTALSINCRAADFLKGLSGTTNAVLSRTLFAGKKGSGKPGVFEIRFRFYADSTGNPENIRESYEIWKKGTPSAAKGNKL